MENKKADIPVMILVIGVFAVCSLAILSFVGSNNFSTTDYLGIEYWDLKNDEGLGVAYGLYVYVIKTRDGNKHIGKFSVIR